MIPFYFQVHPGDGHISSPVSFILKVVPKVQFKTPAISFNSFWAAIFEKKGEARGLEKGAGKEDVRRGHCRYNRL
jgi:hypothetical protein